MWFVNYRKVSPACTHAQEEAFTMPPGVSSTISLAWATNDLFPLGSHAELLLCPWVTPLVLWFLCSNSPGQLWCATTGPLSPHHHRHAQACSLPTWDRSPGGQGFATFFSEDRALPLPFGTSVLWGQSLVTIMWKGIWFWGSHGKILVRPLNKAMRVEFVAQ